MLRDVAADAARRRAGSASTGRSSTAGGARRSTQVAVYNEELARADAPPLLGRAGVSLVGPTLMAHGTEEQRAPVDAADPLRRRRVVPAVQRARRGERPRRLSTRAEQRGDVYRVTGQKVWSSYARFADWGIALVRTDPDAPTAPGHLDARDPDDARRASRSGRCARSPARASSTRCSSTTSRSRSSTCIGPEHEGWRVANTTLANERGASFVWKEQVLHEVAIERLAADVRARAGAVDDPRRAPAARAVVDRRRDLPPAQPAHARAPRARRGARRRSRAS